jgi:hypothetical protein
MLAMKDASFARSDAIGGETDQRKDNLAALPTLERLVYRSLSGYRTRRNEPVSALAEHLGLHVKEVEALLRRALALINGVSSTENAEEALD